MLEGWKSGVSGNTLATPTTMETEDAKLMESPSLVDDVDDEVGDGGGGGGGVLGLIIAEDFSNVDGKKQEAQGSAGSGCFYYPTGNMSE